MKHSIGLDLNKFAEQMKSWPSEKPLKIYVCGPTLYRKPHIGNFRVFYLLEMMISIARKHSVTIECCASITDFGLNGEGDIDKVREETGGADYRQYVQKYYEYFIECLSKLHLTGVMSVVKFVPASSMPKSYEEHIRMAAERGFADKETGGYKITEEVINKSKLYMINGGKRLNRFFLAKKNELGIVTYEGQKYDPSWHLECYLIIKNHLGGKVDYHLGGIDLMDIHHNGEIVHNYIENMCGAHCNKHLADEWVYVESVLSEGKMMSKSKGTVVYVEDAISEMASDTLKLFFAKTHTGKKLNYSKEQINQFKQELKMAFKKLGKSPECSLALGEDNEYNCVSLINSFKMGQKPAYNKLWEVLGDNPEYVFERLSNVSKYAYILYFDPTGCLLKTRQIANYLGRVLYL